MADKVTVESHPIHPGEPEKEVLDYTRDYEGDDLIAAAVIYASKSLSGRRATIILKQDNADGTFTSYTFEDSTDPPDKGAYDGITGWDDIKNSLGAGDPTWDEPKGGPPKGGGK